MEITIYEQAVFLIPCIIIPTLFVFWWVIKRQAMYLRAINLNLTDNKAPFWLQYTLLPLASGAYALIIKPMQTYWFIIGFTVIFWAMVLLILGVWVYLINSEALALKRRVTKEEWKNGLDK